MKHLFHVDAFTNAPFKGNPAAVCICDGSEPEEWMMHVASEMNLSETAFLTRRAAGYGLRWFTPEKEVSLCGHATLASAHVLWEEHLVDIRDSIDFHTLSGVLTARKRAAAITLDFPARLVEPAGSCRPLNEALGVEPLSTHVFTTPKGTLYLLELADEEKVRGLKPDFRKLSESLARAVIVTSRSGTDAQDFVSRYFAPAIGIDEDPVTGSAHCYLAPYWSARLAKADLVGFQASRRGGYVRCRHDKDRVYLEGEAVTVFKADLRA